MKKQYKSLAVITVGLGLLFAQCQKSVPELKGTASVADFDFAQDPPSDTLPYIYKMNFTNKSKEEFLYQWNFGDNSALSSEKNPSHIFSVGGSYNVTLTTVGTNGNNSVTKVIAVADACQNAFYQNLTGCATGEWTWSSDGDAIKVLSPDASTVYFAGSAANCQADDIFKFSKDGTFTYDANGQTFDVQSGYSCQPSKANAPKFKVVAPAGGPIKIILDGLTSGTGRPFIGTTDVVENNTYTVQSYAPDQMTLRSVIEGSGGVLLEVKLKRLTILTLADIKNLLTGGSSKNWKLDPNGGANAIIVGTESNPAQYFGGGALDGCQTDDIYTFSSNNKLTYNAAGSTFNGGNVSPNYNCGSDRSYTDLDFGFAATTGGVAGIATITLPTASAPPTHFIGVTDVPTENVYRIIEITASKMTLRAGNGSGTVFQFKFIAQ